MRNVIEFCFFLDELYILKLVIFFVKNGVVVNVEIGIDLFLYFVVVLGWRMIEFLIENGVNINYVGKDNIILLMNYILKNGNFNYSIINILWLLIFVDFDVELFI